MVYTTSGSFYNRSDYNWIRDQFCILHILCQDTFLVITKHDVGVDTSDFHDYVNKIMAILGYEEEIVQFEGHTIHDTM